ncbi:MAG: hypothetical protein F9K29_10485 [Hyphomicrobiaceae bacterium]|nr:MAG: hypothetical protein F9K29_10485 [Hyphomicrobiaceae bacterium]
MAARSRYSTARTDYEAFDAEDRYGHDEFWPGERIGPPPSGNRGRAVLRVVVVLLIALGGGWALLGDPAAWPSWQSIEAIVSSWTSRSAPEPVERATLAVATTPRPARLEPVQPPAVASPPSSVPSPASSTGPTPDIPERPVAPLTTASLPPAATAPSEATAPPGQPPVADYADPHQKRAAAVGLHPDLSRVLLARLSPTDYRNAEIAIRTAVAETPDTAVYVWPRQRKPELALFQVRFVQGAAPGCRRYVVTITKDGWLTTALPMEKCGPQLTRSRRE